MTDTFIILLVVMVIKTKFLPLKTYKLYALVMRSLLHVISTSIKLLKKQNKPNKGAFGFADQSSYQPLGRSFT